jgi:deazaflavin-dependent oxidoreductase (nitroreductase family)
MSDSADYLYLTTIGRRTGLERQIEIWFVAHEGRYYLVSEGRERAQWVQNIAANPHVTLQVGSRDAHPRAALARSVDPDAEPELAAAVRAKMDAKYQWSDGLIVELSPQS